MLYGGALGDKLMGGDGADVIALAGYGVPDGGELICGQDGVNAVVSNFGGGTIIPADFDCTDLDNDDFVFG